MTVGGGRQRVEEPGVENQQQEGSAQPLPAEEGALTPSQPFLRAAELACRTFLPAWGTATGTQFPEAFCRGLSRHPLPPPAQLVIITGEFVFVKCREPFPLKSPVGLREGAACCRPGPWQGWALKSAPGAGLSTAPSGSVCHCRPGTCRRSLHSDLSVLITCADVRHVGERARLCSGADMGGIVPGGSPAPPSWILPSLTPLATPTPIQGPSVPPEDPHSRPGPAHPVGSWTQASPSGSCSGSELSGPVEERGTGPPHPWPLGRAGGNTGPTGEHLTPPPSGQTPGLAPPWATPVCG